MIYEFLEQQDRQKKSPEKIVLQQFGGNSSEKISNEDAQRVAKDIYQELHGQQTLSSSELELLKKSGTNKTRS